MLLQKSLLFFYLFFCQANSVQNLRTFTIFKSAVVYMYVYYQAKNVSTLLHLLVFEFDVSFNKFISYSQGFPGNI